MSHTLYASFANPEDAECAAGALIDHGVRAEDLSVVRQHIDGTTSTTAPAATASNVIAAPTEREPAPVPTGSVYGVSSDAPVVSSSETAATPHPIDLVPDASVNDVGASTKKGTMIGAGIGVVAAIAALAIPGVGFILGAGALASALGGIAATAGAGAAAGAIVGYLKEAGVDEDVASGYGETVQGGGAVLAVTVPSGTVDEDAASTILNQHAATNVNRYATRGSAI